MNDHDDNIQSNIVSINRPSGSKGRRVLKKRPIRIKIPALLRENLQVIPESVNVPIEVESDSQSTTVTPVPVTPSAVTTVAQTFIQEERQPKALTVFSEDYDYDEEQPFGQDTSEAVSVTQ